MIQIADTEITAGTVEHVEGLVGGFLTQTSSDGILTARIQTDRTTAVSLLDEPFVLGVETYIQPQASDERQALSLTGASTLAGAVTIANSGTASGTNYRKWLNKYNFTPSNLTNSNIVVDIADYGVDNGCASDITSIRSHLDLRGRVVYHNGATNGSGELGQEKDPDYADFNGHGTLVAGIVAGNPLAGIDIAGQSTTGRGTLDSDTQGQFYYGMGVAPGIRIGSTVMMAGGQFGQVVDWTTRAVSRYCNTPTSACTSTTTLCRATVQNHSNNEYESTGKNAGYYTTSAMLFDKSVRRADHTSLDKPLAVTVSAGNIGQMSLDPTTRVLAPATAKNVISVGSVESSRATTPQTCLDDLSTGDNPQLRHKAEGYNVLAYGSRRGTIDNRFKPDLLAPATLAMGSRGYYGGSYCMTGGGLDSGGKPNYHGSSGTSLAAPVAAGSIALLRHFYASYGLVPSPAMYKAMLVAGARSITGSLDRKTGGTVSFWPNEQQGFGVIGLENLFSPAVYRSWQDQQATPLLQSYATYFTATVSDPSKPVKIVLAWTDKEGSVQDPDTGGPYRALVNDLDLIATLPEGYTYYGNFMDIPTGYSRLPEGCGRPSCPTPADTRNNVEVLNIDPARFVNPANRTFTVRVWAANLNGAGVPGAAGGANNQDFALFAINAGVTQLY